MNASLVISDRDFVLEGRSLTLDQLGTALHALPPGTSVVVTLKKGAGNRGGSMSRQVAKLIHAAGLVLVLLDVSDFDERPTPGKPITG